MSKKRLEEKYRDTQNKSHKKQFDYIGVICKALSKATLLFSLLWNIAPGTIVSPVDEIQLHEAPSFIKI